MASSQMNGPTGEESVAELTRRLSDETTRLVRAEVELAKAELAAKGKQVGVGAGMFGGAGLVGLYALGALTAAVILALSTAVAGWLAALIVAVVYAAVAGVLALRGKSQVQSATPPVPERAVESVKEDFEWTKQRVKSVKQ
jgi:uncharacterized membrane protein YqjE